MNLSPVYAIVSLFCGFRHAKALETPEKHPLSKIWFCLSNVHEIVKSHQEDGKVKSSRCKARTSFKAVRRNLEE
jgi:hypothetical protein